MLFVKRTFLLATLATLLYPLILGFSLWLETFDQLVSEAQILSHLIVATTLPARALIGWCRLHLELTLPFMPVLWLTFVSLALGWRWLRSRPNPAPSSSGPRVSRRAFLSAGLATLLAGSLQGFRGREQLTTVHHQLALKQLPSKLEGLRLVLLADLHRGPATPREYLQRVVDHVNGLQPDLVLLPGDFVSKSSYYFKDIQELLAQLQPRIASLATLGNHDHWEGTEQARAAVRDSGVVLLENSAVVITPKRSLGDSSCEQGLCLAGVDDLWAGKPDLNQALAGVSADIPRLLLSHNPDFAEEKAALEIGQRVDLQLSGHTHGGQVVLPGVGAVASASRYGLKYIYGFSEGPSWPVFTTRGIGTSTLPLRLGAPPEVVVFELSRA